MHTRANNHIHICVPDTLAHTATISQTVMTRIQANAQTEIGEHEHMPMHTRAHDAVA